MERINRGMELENFGLDDKTIRDIKNLPLIFELGKKVYRENSEYGVWDSHGYKHHIHSKILKECLDIFKPLADRMLEESEPISIKEILNSFNEIKEEKINSPDQQELDGTNQRKKIEQPPFPSYDGNSNFIFISYSHEDKIIVYQQLEWLHVLEYNIWYDEGIPPTTQWAKIIPKKIYDSNLFILFLSTNSIKSANVNRELSYAIKYNKIILPIYLENLTLPDDFEFNLGPIQGVMKHEMEESDYKTKIIKTIRDNGLTE